MTKSPLPIIQQTKYSGGLPMRDKLIHSATNACFHVVNHAVDGRELYYDAGDYKSYLHFFKEALNSDVTVLVYCLMPNHFHFLLRQNAYEAISSLFEAAHKRYARYYNKKHGYKGKIFRQRLNHRETMGEEHILNAAAYIHANPVHANLAQFPEEWEFSNFQEYLRMRKGSLYSERFLLDYIGNPENYRKQVIELARKKGMQRAFMRDVLQGKG